MDTAVLNLFNYLDQNVSIETRQSECYKCSRQSLGWLKAQSNRSLYINTAWPTEFLIKYKTNDSYCLKRMNFQESGRYDFVFAKQKCYIVAQYDAWDFCIPLYVAIGIMAFLVFLWIFIRFLLRQNLLQKILCCLPKYDLSVSTLQEDLGTPRSVGYVVITTDSQNAMETKNLNSRPRLRSLDSFRGFCLFVMIFVNCGGGGYVFFQHAAWNGLHVADLVFPWFIFIMGTAMGLSLNTLIRREGKIKASWSIARRSFILFLLGIVLNSSSGGWLADLRIPGVLQRFGICFLVVGLTEVISSVQTLPNEGAFRDQRTLISHWLLQLALLSVHLCLTLLLPLSDGCPTGYVGPGGRHLDGRYWNCTGGAASYIDRLILGPRHLYQQDTAVDVYGKGGIHDPEGLLGCLTSCVLCFLGLNAGKILAVFPEPAARLKRFWFWGLLTGGIGTLLCKASQEEGWIPLNKNLWSASFILCMAGSAYILLSIVYLVVDVFNVWCGAPFLYLGMNSIVVYVGSEILNRYLPFNFQVQNTHAQHLTIDLISPAVWTLVAYFLYKRKVFISI